MLVYGIGTWRTRAKHKGRTMTVTIQIQWAIAFFTATTFALLFHHHAAPFSSSILKPHLQIRIGQNKIGGWPLHIDLAIRMLPATPFLVDQFSVTIALSLLHLDCGLWQNRISWCAIDDVWMRFAFVWLVMRHSSVHHDQIPNRDSPSLNLQSGKILI